MGLLLILTMILGLAACGTKENEIASGTNQKESGDQDKSNNEDTDTKDKETESEDEPVVDNSLQYILDNGKFILGLDDSFPPMGFRDDENNIVGFDIDLARAVCEKLGVELVLQPIEWAAKEMELSTKNIDCIWNGFSITDERLKNLTMTAPYLENNISLIVLGDSDITSMADMAGKRLALQSGSSAEEALNSEANKEFKDSLGEINGFDDYVTALMDLETKTSDAVLMDTVVANYMISSAGKDFKVLDETLVADEYAIGFRKGEEALCEAVWNALIELKAEGKIEEIAIKWFGSDITLIP